MIEGGRILAVGSDRSVRIPKGARRIDGRGLTVLPGLIDCHVHLCLGAEADVVAAVERDSSTLTLLKAAEWLAARCTPVLLPCEMWDFGTMLSSP